MGHQTMLGGHLLINIPTHHVVMCVKNVPMGWYGSSVEMLVGHMTGFVWMGLARRKPKI